MISSRVCKANLSLIRNAASKVKILNPSADVLPFKGIDADKKPVSVKLEAGKTYSWCSCGHSKIQPFCDGTHKIDGYTMNKPVQFQVEKSGEYMLCNCKQTDKRPICDGSHKMVSPIPRNANASRFVMYGDSPVYDGVARDLGYKPKDGGFQ